MAIHFLSGKPRGGKTLYGVKLVLDELLYGSRVVVTNLPLRLGALHEYLVREYPKRDIDLTQRVMILTDDEAARFWCVRPNGVRIRCLEVREWQDGKRPDYSAVADCGVMFVIDEIHNYFNARAWMETGRDVLFYLSQHGKLGDTVVCITQHVGNVDKQFRSVTQDYTYLRNLSKERMGLFRMPAIFTRKTFLQPATDKSVSVESGTFRLDVSGLASCYDTAQGVGIHGRAADKTEKKRGVHWLVFAVGAPLLLISLLHYVPQLLARATNVTVPVTAKAASSAGKPVVVPAGQLGQVVLASLPLQNAGPLILTNVTVKGWVPVGRDLRILLSDGRILSTEKGDVADVRVDSFLIPGEGLVKVPRGTF